MSADAVPRRATPRQTAATGGDIDPRARPGDDVNGHTRRRAAPGKAPQSGRRAGAGNAAAGGGASAGVPAAFLQARPPGAADDGDTAADTDARTWVYRHASGAIVEGLLWPGLRLPSARELSRCWGVARGAVDQALKRLAREGLLERRVGRGSFVARRLPPGMVREVSGRAALAHRPGVALHALAPLLRLGRQPAVGGQDGDAALPPGEGATAPAAGGAPAAPRMLWLNPRVPDTALFPLAAWRRCLGAAHAEADRASLCYGLPGGWPALREATARHLALTRAIECRPEQVLILNGPLQALDLVVRVLLEPGDSVVVERPGYMSIARTVGLPPLDLRGAPVDDDGLDVEAARRECARPSLVYLHPLNQYPTGARLSAARRTALLAWVEACRAWVIEGDHLGEVVHDGAVPPALMRAGTRDDGQVLFLGTFNGLMFPGLRLSYLVVPPRLVPAFTAVRGLFGDHPPLAPQQALAAFMGGGHLGTHLRRMREVYRTRRNAVLAAAQRHLPAEVRLGPLLGGTHGCLHLPAGCDDEPLVQGLAAAGFGVEMLSPYFWPQRGTGGVVFGYGADDEQRIDASLRLAGAHIRQALRLPGDGGLKRAGAAAGAGAGAPAAGRRPGPPVAPGRG
ncbi:MAG: PLP-dependent aminotransferase family protein [Rubrivivax sp.]|nr:PLP-dependent aminotransferase family protein [Rubrivivax sp.]